MEESSILDRNLFRLRTEMNPSVFEFFFAEIVKYYYQQCSHSLDDLHRQLHALGASVGSRLVDSVFYRERNFRRETKIEAILYFIQVGVWKSLFGREADKLAQSSNGSYYIVEKEPLMNRFISPSSELLDQAGHSQLNCAFFSAGLIEQFLRDVGLDCQVSAHWDDSSAEEGRSTVYVIVFTERVLERDRSLK